ncbi:protein cornichon homolog 4-like [Magnolia sinica]|uniref:protein cornichon homolog 4-like n=1 Tax=Magnolia sinica TaxID=86752 RepID=UPI002658BDD3|nr:protein cornichon homolog 4-like [Magnolia sinica]
MNGMDEIYTSWWSPQSTDHQPRAGGRGSSQSVSPEDAVQGLRSGVPENASVDRVRDSLPARSTAYKYDTAHFAPQRCPNNDFIVRRYLFPFLCRCSARVGRKIAGTFGDMMEGDLLVWLLSFFILIALLGLLVYQLMCLADLEFDYINPYDSASRINSVILPEFVTQGVLCAVFLLSGHWIMFLFSAPNLYYNVKLYTARQHLIDVTEIFNLLNREKKQRLFKLIYLVFLLFLSIFWMVWSALEDD